MYSYFAMWSELGPDGIGVLERALKIGWRGPRQTGMGCLAVERGNHFPERSVFREECGEPLLPHSRVWSARSSTIVFSTKCWNGAARRALSGPETR